MVGVARQEACRRCPGIDADEYIAPPCCWTLACETGYCYFVKLADKERGANVRRNLRRWWKPLLVMMAGWLLLSLAVCAAAITYAHANHFTQSRIHTLAEGCAAIMSLILVASWLTVFVMADRRKSGQRAAQTKAMVCRNAEDD